MFVFDPNKAMKYVTAEGIAATVMFAIMNTFLTVFAAELGASNMQIGLVVALPAMVALLSYIPSAYVTEIWNNRKRTCIVFSFLSRFMWVFVGLIPFLILSNVITTISQGITLLILLLSAYYGFGTFVSTSWASMVGVIIPDKIRGQYFGRRNQLCAIASLVSGTVAGFVLQVFNNSLLGFSVIFIAAGIAGIMSSFFFSRFPDVRFEPEKVMIFSELRKVMSNSPFRTFMLIMMMWQFGVSMSAPFMNVYLIEGLNAEYVWLSIIVFVHGISTILVQKGWGAVADTFGHRSIVIISAFGASFVPLLWMLAPSPDFAVAINILAGVAWAGFNLANFNYMLEISTGGKRTIYSAFYWTIIYIPMIFAPIAGGWLADALVSMPLGLLNSFKGMFFISWVIRAVAVALFARMLFEVPARERIPAKHVAREIVGIGFHSIEQPFHLVTKRGFSYTGWLAMRLLGEIKELGRLPRKTRNEVMALERSVKDIEETEARYYQNTVKRLRKILEKVRRKKAKEEARQGT